MCLILGAAILLPVFRTAKLAAKSSVSISKAKQLALAMAMYTNDYDDTYPSFSDAGQLATLLAPYCRNPIITDSITSYKWNQELSKKVYVSLPDQRSIWLFASKEPDELHKYYVGFVDGHAAAMYEDQYRSVTAKSVAGLLKDSGSDTNSGDIHKIWTEHLNVKGVGTTVQYDFASPTTYDAIIVIHGKSGSSVPFSEKYRGTGTYKLSDKDLTLNSATTVQIAVKADGQGEWTRLSPNSKNREVRRAYQDAKANVFGLRFFTVASLSDKKLDLDSPDGSNVFLAATAKEVLKP
jgi:hypothetical protein